MATKFPKFSQALAQDPATRRIWFGLATAHDFESHDGMTEENLYQKNEKAVEWLKMRFVTNFIRKSLHFAVNFRNCSK